MRHELSTASQGATLASSSKGRQRAAAPREPRIVFVNLHYHPDVAATAQRLTDLAEYLAGRGFTVEVVCGRGGYVGESRRAPVRERHNGVLIRRVRTASFGRSSSLGRIVDYATFIAGAFWRLVTGRRADLVVMLTTPPLLGTLGAALARIRRQRYAIWSMDLHPDAEIALGMLRRGRRSTALLERLNEIGYVGADLVVDLGPCMRERIARKGVAGNRLVTIPVWGNDPQPVDPADNALLDAWGIRGKFVVLYAGNAGLAHRFDEVLEAMDRLKDHPELVFLFVGGGARKAAILEYVRSRGIGNAQYRDYVPQELLPQVLSLGDVHLITLRPDMSGIAVPSKLYDSLAVGRPVLFLGPEASDTGRTIRASGAGLVVEPAASGSATEAIVDTLLELHRDPTLRQAYARAGRVAYERHFRREVLCRCWHDVLRAHQGEHDEAPTVPTGGGRSDSQAPPRRS